MAASQIATSTGNFFIITSVCIAIGASIMLGNELGADNIRYCYKLCEKILCISNYNRINFWSFINIKYTIITKNI